MKIAAAAARCDGRTERQRLAPGAYANDCSERARASLRERGAIRSKVDDRRSSRQDRRRGNCRRRRDAEARARSHANLATRLFTSEARVLRSQESRHLLGAQVIAFCAFFLWANFIVAPAAHRTRACGSYFCRAYFVVAAIDFAVPLRPGVRGCGPPGAAGPVLPTVSARTLTELVVEGDEEGQVYCAITARPLRDRVLADDEASLRGVRFDHAFTAADVIVYIPILRRIMTWWGYTPASRGPMVKNMQHASVQRARTAPRRHRGHVLRHARADRPQQAQGLLQNCVADGCHIVPSYVFGANEVYTRYFEHTGAMAFSSVLQTSLKNRPLGHPEHPVPHRSKLSP